MKNLFDIGVITTMDLIYAESVDELRKELQQFKGLPITPVRLKLWKKPGEDKIEFISIDQY